MGILRKLFGRTDESRSSGGSAGATGGQSPADLQRAQDLAARGCWAASLWLATKVLEADPRSTAAKSLFSEAAATTLAVGFASLLASMEAGKASADQLRKRGRMTLEEARSVAEHLTTAYYVDELRGQFDSYLKRVKAGEMGKARVVPPSDLESARLLAGALADFGLPGTQEQVTWSLVINPDAQSFLTSIMKANSDALLILLRTDSPTQWQAACERLGALWSGVKTGEEMAARLRKIVADGDAAGLEEAEFQRYRDQFEDVFLRGAALYLLTRNTLRQPA